MDTNMARAHQLPIVYSLNRLAAIGFVVLAGGVTLWSMLQNMPVDSEPSGPPKLGAANPGVWSPLQPSSFRRSEANLVVYDGGVFHFNGFNELLGIENSIERYDLDTGIWETVGETSDAPGFPTALTHNGLIVVDGEAWLIGGRVGRHPGWVTDSIVILDLNTYTWRDGPTLPVPFAGGGAVLIDQRIHVFGGLDENAECDVDLHLVYDLDSPADGWQDWSDTAPFPQPRNHFATVLFEDHVYVIGGQIGHDNCAAYTKQRQQTNLVHRYNPESNTWTKLGNLPWVQSHAEPSTFVHNDRIWMIGGVSNADRVLSYDANTDEWTWHAELDLPQDLLAPGARIFNGNQMYIFGGGAPSTKFPVNDTLIASVPWLVGDQTTNSDEDSEGETANEQDIATTGDNNIDDETDATEEEMAADVTESNDNINSNTDSDSTSVDEGHIADSSSASEGENTEPTGIETDTVSESDMESEPNDSEAGQDNSNTGETESGDPIAADDPVSEVSVSTEENIAAGPVIINTTQTANDNTTDTTDTTNSVQLSTSTDASDNGGNTLMETTNTTNQAESVVKTGGKGASLWLWAILAGLLIIRIETPAGKIQKMHD